jgi:hypothetical protein
MLPSGGAPQQIRNRTGATEMSRHLTSFAAFFLPELRAAGCFVPCGSFLLPDGAANKHVPPSKAPGQKSGGAGSNSRYRRNVLAAHSLLCAGRHSWSSGRVPLSHHRRGPRSVGDRYAAIRKGKVFCFEQSWPFRRVSLFHPRNGFRASVHTTSSIRRRALYVEIETARPRRGRRKSE